MCVRERESRDTKSVDTDDTQVENILTKEKDTSSTKWEEGALYSHPLSSLTTRLMEHGE